ncbi:MAG: 3-hydroxybutyryl-CoA dehydrogenase [Planctomycetes bacterium]|nr:3-hydroxybutyryl-CoA dehydrogenase [Planctomycetota bacterium]
MSIHKVGVIGAGTMGNGIAQVFAASGFDVVLCDVAQAALDKAVSKVVASVRKMAEKGGKDPAAAEADIRARIKTTTDLASMDDRDLVVEAAFESLEVKRAIFQKLDAVCPPHTILASNTSSISITVIGATTKRAPQVIGMHFMNPVPIMKLIEIIRGHLTSDATTNAIVEMSKTLGKVPVPANDYPGFVANRILMPMINEAAFALMEGVATAKDIDEVMKLGCNHPMGPLTLADFIGLDVCVAILDVLHQGLGDDKYRACPLLRRMVAAGLLGKKSGRGFYDYSA